MKKTALMLCALLVLGVSAFANDINVNYRDSIAATDTTGAGTVRLDTTFSGWERIDGAQKIHFYAKVLPLSGVIDTNFANDSFFVDVQLSIDKIGITKLIQLDTFLTTDSAWTGNDALVADSLRGNYMRVRAIHHAPKAPVAAFENIYGKRFQLWYAVIKEQ